VKNVELFKKIYRQITDHPETHDQGIWESDCGTARCVAGWALYFHNSKQSVHRTAEDILWGEGPRSTLRGSWEAIAAKTILGLTDDEAEDLFFEGKEDWVVERVKEYAGL